MHAESFYLGRLQQGTELQLVLQCRDAAGEPEDPLHPPVASIYRDGGTPTFLESVSLAAALRGVATGVFRLPLFLGPVFSVATRHLLILRWVDQAGRARQRVGVFNLIPGGSPDGAVTAIHYVNRPDARYLMYSTDGGRLLRGRNPR